MLQRPPVIRVRCLPPAVAPGSDEGAGPCSGYDAVPCEHGGLAVTLEERPIRHDELDLDT